MTTMQPAEDLLASPFGPDDELGMLNHVDDAPACGLSLVRAGRLYDLGRILDERVPVFPGRSFHQTLVTTAHHANMGGLGENCVNWITETFSSTTQLGTHLDALSHLQIGDRGYYGGPRRRFASPGGVTALGVETVPQIVTRGLPGGRLLLSARPRRRDRSSTHGRRRPRARRRGALSHRLGRALGRRRRVPRQASRGPGSSWPSGWPRAASRSPAATPGATARCRPRTRRGRSRCRRR